MTKLGLFVLCALPAPAQSVVSAQAGTIEFTQGDVFVDEQPVRATVKSFPSLKDGQVLRTGRGRVEVLLAPAVFLRLGSQSSVRMVNTSLEDTHVELQKGRALVEVVDTVKGDRIQIEAGETRTEFKRSGLYRFDPDQGELRVFGGEAEVRVAGKKAAAGRGRAVRLNDSLAISKFDRKKVDGLYQWSARRSFYLFVSSREARAHRTNWEFTVVGALWNRDFGMRFYSGPAAAEHRRKVEREEREKTDFERLKKYDP